MNPLNDRTFAKAMFADVPPEYVHTFVISDGKGGTYTIKKTQAQLDEEYDALMEEAP
jgi:hypothetical protein